MNKIYFISNDKCREKFEELIELLKKNGFDLKVAATLEELQNDIKDFFPQVVILADCGAELLYEYKKLKSFLDKENVMTMLIENEEKINSDEPLNVQSFVKYSGVQDFEVVLNNIKSLVNIRKNIQTLVANNADLQKSLYQLDTLYHTSFQFAGTLNKTKLINILVDGVEKSLSYNISYAFIIEDENKANLIINSLQPISSRLEKSLKLRAMLTYKTLFAEKRLPAELNFDDIKVEKNIKHRFNEYDLNIFKFDNLFSLINVGDKFFGFLEVFKETEFTSEDATCFQTLSKQVSVPLESALLYEEISNTNLKLERLERLKSEFISIVSHELRTPLTAIKNSLDIMLSGATGELSTNADKFLNTAKRNVSRLAAIINDLLDLSKIEAGKMQLHFEKINIVPTVDFMKNTFAAQANEKEIELVSNIQTKDNELFICADQLKIEQILSNLISNAIKFTPNKGKITLSVEKTGIENLDLSKFCKTIQGVREYILISVKDTGIGIKEEDSHKVFDEFQQIENSTTRKIGGTGLGLPIAKQLSENHFGAIWFDSTPQVGTTFYVALPIYDENVAFRLDCESALQASQIHKKTLVLIRLKESLNSDFSLIDELKQDMSIVTSAVSVEFFEENTENARFLTLKIPEADKFAADFIIKKLNTILLQKSQTEGTCDILYSKVVFPDDEPDSKKVWAKLTEEYKKLGQEQNG